MDRIFNKFVKLEDSNFTAENEVQCLHYGKRRGKGAASAVCRVLQKDLMDREIKR